MKLLILFVTSFAINAFTTFDVDFNFTCPLPDDGKKFTYMIDFWELDMWSFGDFLQRTPVTSASRGTTVNTNVYGLVYGDEAFFENYTIGLVVFHNCTDNGIHRIDLYRKYLNPVSECKLDQTYCKIQMPAKTLSTSGTNPNTVPNGYCSWVTCINWEY